MRWLAAVMFVGCGFTTPAGSVTSDGRPGGEAGVQAEAGAGDDAPPPVDAAMIDGCTSFSSIINTCAVGGFGPGVSIAGNKQYNTNTHVLSDDPGGGNPTTPMFREDLINGGEVTLLVVASVSISGGNHLRVTGTRAFGIVASSSVTLAGDIDASNGGAGARTAAACGTSAGGAGKNNTLSSGGG